MQTLTRRTTLGGLAAAAAALLAGGRLVAPSTGASGSAPAIAPGEPTGVAADAPVTALGDGQASAEQRFAVLFDRLRADQRAWPGSLLAARRELRRELGGTPELVAAPRASAAVALGFDRAAERYLRAFGEPALADFWPEWAAYVDRGVAAAPAPPAAA